KMRYDVHARRVEPAEERLAVIFRFLDESQREVTDLVIYGFHPFWIKRAGVLDLLFAYLAPARHHCGVIRSGRPGMDHVAGADFIQQLLRVVGMRRVFHRVQVIEVAEEFVEAVDGRQEFIQIAEMVLAELSSLIALGFEGGSDRAGFSRYADLGPRLADRRHASANGQFTHD